MKRRVVVISVVPSPYQRDLFAAMAVRPELDLEVCYLEPASPDSPWPEKPLQPYERVLPGFWLPLGSARIHLNWNLPKLQGVDLVIVNTLMSLTAQWLMRGPLRGKRWMFLGEKLAQRKGWHSWLAAPLNRAAGIAAIGTWAQRDYAARFPAPKTFCLPYYCDLDPFFAQPRHEVRSEPVMLFCGQMIARKGVDLLLSEFAKLEKCRLLLVGREAELPALLSSLPEEVRSRIEYAGFQAPEALPKFFGAADLFVLPSRYDGWGVVVNQAIAAGLPVICSDQVGAGHDLVEDGVNGLRFKAGDAASLGSALRRLVDAPELIEQWGNASREKARMMTPAIGAERWVRAIEEVLGQ